MHGVRFATNQPAGRAASRPGTTRRPLRCHVNMAATNMIVVTSRVAVDGSGVTVDAKL
jgi:hypothetical protein